MAATLDGDGLQCVVNELGVFRHTLPAERQAGFSTSRARYRLLKVGSEPSPPGLVNLAQPFLGFQRGLSQRLIRIRHGC